MCGVTVRLILASLNSTFGPLSADSVLKGTSSPLSMTAFWLSSVTTLGAGDDAAAPSPLEGLQLHVDDRPVGNQR